MHSLFRLFMSLILSAAIVVALAAAGVIRFNPDAQLEPAAMGAKVQSGLTAALEKVQAAEYLAEVSKEPVSAPSAQPGQPDRQTPGLASEPAALRPEAIPLPAEKAPAPESAIDAALAVLAAWGDQPAGANPEIVLRRRLQTLGITPERVDQIVRMSFWKGFVTLQGGPADAPGAEEDALHHALEQELALKQAGFAALGLRTGDALVEQARRELQIQQAFTSGGEQR